MPVKRYYVRKRGIDNRRMIDGRVGSSDELLNLKEYIQDVFDEHVTIDEGLLSSLTTLTLTAGTELDLTATENLDLNAGTSATLDSATTLVITGGTGAQVRATTGELDLTSTAANVDINGATTVTMDSGTVTTITGGTNVIVAATAGDVTVTAGDDIILTPTGNLTFTLAAIATYADDTAAGVGGLTAGQVYKTAAGALMIKL